MPPPSLLTQLSALANPHRLAIVARLAAGRQYVSQLAREVGLSRPLLHMHLKRLDEAGLLESEMEISPDGKAMKFYRLAPFHILLTPDIIQQVMADAPPTTSDSQ